MSVSDSPPGLSGRPSDGPSHDRVRSLSLPEARGAVAYARDFTRAALRDWGWAPARADADGAGTTGDERAAAQAALFAAEDVVLLVSELVTNACRHAEGPRDLRLERLLTAGGGLAGLRVTVGDGSARRPERRAGADGARPGGYGIPMVERLARSWGCEARPGGGKTVWAEFAPPGKAPRAGAAG